MWRRVARLGSAVVGGTSALLVYGHLHDKGTSKSEISPLKVVSPPASKSLPASPSLSNDDDENLKSAFRERFPVGEWNKNWDFRDPSFLAAHHKEWPKANEERRRELIKESTPKAARHIILIRHGQYHLDADVKCLTELGREQAQLVGERLAKSGFQFDSLVMSTMVRATETAKLIAEKLPATVPQTNCQLIEEGAPYPCVPRHATWSPRPHYLKHLFADSARIDAAFRRHIHRASPRQAADSHEIIVCHGNVIRYFFCRALQFPPEGWLRMSIGHSSITYLVIHPSGFVSVRSLGDIGHLPREKVSFG